MPSPINKKLLHHLAELARIELVPREEERFLKDLQKIVDHFRELQTLDTEGVEPATGGTKLTNRFRGDADHENTNRGAGRDQFPDEQNGYLKVPSVFDR